jgi:hypothetical protein
MGGRTSLSEKQKRLAGELSQATDPELTAGHQRAQELLQRFNAIGAGDLVSSGA